MTTAWLRVSMFRIYIYVIVLCYLVLISQYPIIAMPYAGHDDALFMRGLEHILDGHWLGTYDNLTLAKGPLISIAGAISNSIGLQAMLLEAVLYAASVVAVAFYARRLGMSQLFALILVVLLLSNPYIWSYDGRRFLREPLFFSAAMMVLSLSVMMFFADSKKTVRLHSFGSGIFLGLMYLAREEDIWILSCFGFVVVVSTLRSAIRNGLGSLPAVLKSAVMRGLWVLAGTLVFVGPVLVTNKVMYDRAIVSEFRAPEFKAAIGSMMRVGDIHPSGYVPVTNEAMQAILKNVPAAAALRPHWPEIASGWSNAGAYLIPKSPNELAGGWFVWAVRDAVALAGHYRSANDAKRFYTQLANEVNAACESNILTCRERRDTLRPMLQSDRLPDLLNASLESLIFTLGLSTNSITAPRSTSMNDDLLNWDRRIGPIIIDGPNLRITGWIAHRSTEPALAISDGASECAQELIISPAPDVVTHYEGTGLMGVQGVRFEFSANSDGTGCGALTLTFGSDAQTISLSSLSPGPLDILEPFWGHIDSVLSLPSFDPSPTEATRLTIILFLAATAGFIVPFFVVTSTLGLVLSLFFLKSRSNNDWLIVFSLGAAVLVAGRSAIIGYIHITSWHAISAGYLGPAYPFVIIYAVVGTFVFVNVFRHMINR